MAGSGGRMDLERIGRAYQATGARPYRGGWYGPPGPGGALPCLCPASACLLGEGRGTVRDLRRMEDDLGEELDAEGLPVDQLVIMDLGDLARRLGLTEAYLSGFVAGVDDEDRLRSYSPAEYEQGLADGRAARRTLWGEDDDQDDNAGHGPEED